MEPHRIDVPESFELSDAYVLIRPKRSWSARNRVESAGMFVRSHGEAARRGEDAPAAAAAEVGIDAMALGVAVLETAVISWTGIADVNGRPLPATRRGFMHDDFDSDLGDWLVEQIQAFYAAQQRTEEAGKVEAPSSPEP